MPINVNKRDDVAERPQTGLTIKPRLDACMGPTWYDDDIPQYMVPQTHIEQAKYSPKHGYIKVSK